MIDVLDRNQSSVSQLKSFYFKTIHETMTMWSYIAGGLNLKVQFVHKIALWDQSRWSNNQDGLKIKGCKIEAPLYCKRKFSSFIWPSIALLSSE